MLNERTTQWRRGRRVPALAIAVVALATLGLAACGDDDTEDADGVGNGNGAADPTSFTIGIANERPYGYEEDGEATGEAPELGREVLSRMDIEDVDFEVVEFGALIGGLNAGRYDMIAAGMFINDERAEQVNFADPDYCATTGFAVPEGNPDDLTDFESVIDAGITLGVLAGAVEADYATDSGVPDDQIDVYQTTPDLFDALAAGRIDAATLTAITVREQVADLDGFEDTEGFVPVIDGEEQLGCGAFAFPQDEGEFRDQFNDILNEMKENDEILPIIEEFGFTEAEVETARGVTVGDLVGDGG